MKTTTILKKMYDMKQDDQINILKYHELIEQLKESINMESLPEGSTKKQYKAIKKMLGSVSEFRKLLKLTHMDKKGRQVFTDSYILFRLSGDAIIESLPQTTDDTVKAWAGNYPQTEKLCDPTFKSSLKSPLVKISSLKQLIKTEKEHVVIDLVKDGSYKAALSKKNLKLFIDIMNFKNSDEISFLYPSMGSGFSIRPLGVIYNNREGIILPVRMEA